MITILRKPKAAPAPPKVGREYEYRGGPKDGQVEVFLKPPPEWGIDCTKEELGSAPWGFYKPGSSYEYKDGCKTTYFLEWHTNQGKNKAGFGHSGPTTSTFEGDE